MKENERKETLTKFPEHVVQLLTVGSLQVVHDASQSKHTPPET
jgi:hypothetical protein